MAGISCSSLVNMEAWLVRSSIWGADAPAPTTGLDPLSCLLKDQSESFVILTQLVLALFASSFKAQSSSRVLMYTAGKGDVRKTHQPFPLMRLSHPPGWGRACCHSQIHPRNMPLAQSLLDLLYLSGYYKSSTPP